MSPEISLKSFSTSYRTTWRGDENGRAVLRCRKVVEEVGPFFSRSTTDEQIT
jgi:hypothetical protein